MLLPLQNQPIVSNSLLSFSAQLPFFVFFNNFPQSFSVPRFSLYSSTINFFFPRKCHLYSSVND